jgi:lipoprotein-releasing system permease protein
MRIDALIALRFLRSPRQDRTVSIVTWVSLVGVMLGVTALIVTVSVLNGFRDNLFRSVLATSPHVVIQAPGRFLPAEELARLEAKVAALPGVKAQSPRLSRQAFITDGATYRAVLLNGIDPALEPAVSDLDHYVRGQLSEEAPPEASRDVLAALADPPPGRRSGMVLGESLARTLGVIVGDELRVVSTVQRLTPVGPVPLMKTFQVVGVFATGVGGTDEVAAFISLDTARLLYRMPEAAGALGVRVRDPHDIDLAAFREALPEYQVESWSTANRNVFQVMRLEKLGIFLILSLIIVVGFFNIIASLVMLVLEKRKAVATLKALGASNGLIRRIFFMQGVWIGALGTLAGLSLGLLGCWVLATFDIIRLPAGVFPLLTRLPVLVDPLDLALITGTSFLICMIVTVYPATRAARVNPVENLRYE